MSYITEPLTQASQLILFKDTNPKDKISQSKIPYHVTPMPVIAELSLAFLEGARKYGSYNWRIARVRSSVYYSAALRHLNAYWEGEDTDPDSGLPHLVKAIACLTILRDSQIIGNETDDRPPKSQNNWQAALNKKAQEIISRYPDARSV